VALEIRVFSFTIDLTTSQAGSLTRSSNRSRNGDNSDYRDMMVRLIRLILLVGDSEEDYEIHSENPEGEVDEEGLPLVCKICEGDFKEPI
jgi:hypothetical protein